MSVLHDGESGGLDDEVSLFGVDEGELDLIELADVLDGDGVPLFPDAA